MTRTALAIAAALLAASPFFGSAAEACISCEYVPPPAVAAQQKSPSVERSVPRRERRREASETRAKKKSRVTETSKPEKVRKVEQTQKGEQADKIEKAETVTPSAEVENSSFALGIGTQPTVTAKPQTPGDRGGEHSTIATAALKGSDGAVEAANAADSVAPVSRAQGCSRYFPTVGRTLNVPCE